MRRRSVRPFGQSTSITRLLSMVMALAVLWALYRQVKDPALWRTLFDQPKQSTPVETKPVVEAEAEQITSGPDDRDEDEFAKAEVLFDLVTDKAPLKTREMEAYWKLMEWSRTQPFAEFSRRAKFDVPFTQLWDQPEKYRGKPIRLRLHVRRVLEYDPPDNPLNAKKSYEAWGWTDESRSFPYCVVFTDPPRDLPIGTDVRAEIDFVGYFLKIMTFKAFDNARGAPLLVGRARLVSVPKTASTSQMDWTGVIAFVLACIAIVGYFVWSGTRSKYETKRSNLPNELAGFDSSNETTINVLGENPGGDIDGTAVESPAGPSSSHPAT